ncbi:DUF1822 family protein [Anabaena catenula]|uniref:DUF1822 family protein n=1 Tax=Anabaena catenula FACHB-362 TaxID=2692877 RepID=A0ABR8IYP1_9NOST|nr:DUF1822 family protein [Anabaena catenula]MBD2690289.1 DUF1822 family protein [Anabaena catenula FACHB-362]
MLTNFDNNKSANARRFSASTPQPGEIWELSRNLQFPGEFSANEKNKLYSTEAKSFLQGNTPSRYVMIVMKLESDSETESEWNVVSVMVLSAEINFISDVDLLIPADISGLSQDLLAETWHVKPMLTDNLLQPIGKRLSRDIYDMLLTNGDYHHGLLNQPPETFDIERLGLKVGKRKALDMPISALFHKQEKAWSDVLTIPVAAYRAYVKSVNLTNQLLNEYLEVEQELLQSNTKINKIYINLSRWWQNIFESEWLDFYTLPNFAIATRSHNFQNFQQNSDEIAEIIQQLSPDNKENQRQNAAKRLGEIAVGNVDAIQALVSLLRSTSDDETLWIAVESLRKIDPENPAAGVRRIKLIDLGMDIAGKAVALAVAFLQKIDGDVGVMLQVYPTGNNDYLPPDLKLILLDDSGEILREVTARRADVYVQLKFTCEMREKFSVKLTLGDANFHEDFVI